MGLFSPPKWPSVNPFSHPFALLPLKNLRFSSVTGFARVRIIGTLVPFYVIGNSKEFANYIKKLRLMQAWAKLFIFDVAWLMAIAKIIAC